MVKGVKLLERSAILNMPLKQWNNYRPQHKGIHFALYGHNKKKDHFGVTFYGSTHNPDPRENITVRDLNNELASLPIVDERLRTRIFGKRKVDQFDSKTNQKDTMKGWSGMPYSSGFSGEYDYISSRITNKYKKWIPKEEFKRIKKKNKEVESFGEKKDHWGNKETLVEYGDILKLKA